MHEREVEKTALHFRIAAIRLDADNLSRPFKQCVRGEVPLMCTKIQNVRFDDLHRGGVVLPDGADMENWENVSFGDGCLSRDPEELGREYKGKLFRGRPAEPLKPEEKYIAP